MLLAVVLLSQLCEVARTIVHTLLAEPWRLDTTSVEADTTRAGSDPLCDGLV
jgi:hypothetical protein